MKVGNVLVNEAMMRKLCFVDNQTFKILDIFPSVSLICQSVFLKQTLRHI